MEKLITFAVPCYNSAAYMRKCIDSLLTAGDEAEIILIDDGSVKDETPAICDEYAATYPNIIRAIHQENGGHGEGVNQGLRNATGIYYKVVDSDDWLDTEALAKVLEKLRGFAAQGTQLDMMLANYVYEHVEDNTQNVMRYANVFPRNRIFTWRNIRLFRPDQNILMHSVIYRTALLREVGLILPKHTFYVDNIFVYHPLPAVKTMYYMDVDLYRYFIGRADQSVNEKVMIGRVDQQIRVTKQMIDCVDLTPLAKENPKLYRYMTHYLSAMMAICSVFLTMKNNKDSSYKKFEIWKYLYNHVERTLYRKIRYMSVSTFTHLKGPFSDEITIGIYRVAKKLVKFS